MNTIRAAIASASFAVHLTGCVTVSQVNFSFDPDTGELRWEYHDLASRPGADEKDHSVTNGWDTLKQMIAEEKSGFDPEVVEDISKGLFEEKRRCCVPARSRKANVPSVSHQKRRFCRMCMTRTGALN